MATAVILDSLNNKTNTIQTVDFPVTKIKDIGRNVRISEVLPFRVKFTSIQIEKVGLGNTPGISLQVIGYSNYIL